MVECVPQAAGRCEVECKCHDKHETFDAVGVVELRFFERESAAFEIGEHAFDSPPHAIIHSFVVVRFLAHGDDPRFFMSLLMDDADGGACGFAGDRDVGKEALLAVAQCFQVGFLPVYPQSEIIFEPQSPIPSLCAAIINEGGGAVKTIPHQHQLDAFG